MSTFILLILGLFLSALGAIAPGLINLAVAERTMKRGFRPGIMVAIGAAVTQLIYTFIAIFFIDAITKNAMIGDFIRWTAVLVFLILGVFYLSRKVTVPKQVEVGSSHKHFGYGMMIAAMNMLIIPTWIFIGLWLRSYGYDFAGLRDILTIALGSGLGAMGIFLGYVYLARYIVNRLANVTKYINKTLGYIFIGLATVQLIRIYYYY